METTAGKHHPLGVSKHADTLNFSIYSKQAESVTLCLFDPTSKESIGEFPCHKSGAVWHLEISNLSLPMIYAYKVKKKNDSSTQDILLLDPHAKHLTAPHEWLNASHYHPLGVIRDDPPFDWTDDVKWNHPMHELILYEVHLRGFTKDPSSVCKHPGTFLGMIEKLPYLKKLGINAIELMPIFEFHEGDYHRYNPFTGERLCQFWGYGTVNFFCPMRRYGVDDPVLEFKTLVKECHKAGIEVILDVVFNHTQEGNEWGPTHSFKGIDKTLYYHTDRKGKMNDYTGCGNTLNCNHPIVRDFIRSSLHYWVEEMHVDGFRFDLGAIFYRGKQGEHLQDPPLIEELTHDPILAQTKLIAEPWDAHGMHLLGGFSPEEKRWSEWNDRFRDTVRGFIKGDRMKKKEFATRLCGSSDFFPKRAPTASINMITAHDGFTLRDLVSYNEKHNSTNGEDNRDGHSNNLSWNCGYEGETDDPHILDLRKRQMKNFHVALMVSLGVPMLLSGDEYGHTRFGNNNAWCQDNPLNWFQWNQLENEREFFRFFTSLIHFRKQHPILHQPNYYSPEQIEWHSSTPYHPDWDQQTRFIAFTLKDERGSLYIAFNSHHYAVEATLPQDHNWHLIVSTANASPHDYYEEANAPKIETSQFTLQPYSSIILFHK
ncbi:MAG: glycogen-debranching protein [Chlamydiia bacterium]|nr:glycogen-debranching protein [Chlamydiia bacterium]